MQQDRANEQIVLAWRMEQIRLMTQQQKRLPELRTVLIPQDVSLAHTVASKRAQQRAAWHAFAEHYRVSVRTKVH